MNQGQLVLLTSSADFQGCIDPSIEPVHGRDLLSREVYAVRAPRNILLGVHQSQRLRKVILLCVLLTALHRILCFPQDTPVKRRFGFEYRPTAVDAMIRCKDLHIECIGILGYELL